MTNPDKSPTLLVDGQPFDPRNADHVTRAGRMIASASGENAVVILMVGKNGHPHSQHLVYWSGSCMEVHGLLAQGTDVIQHEVHGLSLQGDGDPPMPKCLERGWRSDGSEHSVRYLLGKLRELESKLDASRAVGYGGGGAAGGCASSGAITAGGVGMAGGGGAGR